MVGKKFWSEKILVGKKNLSENFFGRKKILVGKNLWLKKNWSGKFFGREKLLVGKNFWSGKIFDREKLLVGKLFWSGNFFGLYPPGKWSISWVLQSVIQVSSLESKRTLVVPERSLGGF